MRTKESGDDKFACLVSRLNLSGLTGTKIILWLLAITIVSFVIGFGILAVSGDLPDRHGKSASPFVEGGSLGNTSMFALDGATSGTVSVTMGAGELTIRGGAPEDTLMEATVFSRKAEWQPVITESVTGSVKTVIMTDKGHTAKEWVAVDSPNTWDVLLSGQVPLDLTVHTGAGDSNLDLSHLNLSSLAVETGAGDTEITFGSAPIPGKADINIGVGDLTVRVPKYSNTRLVVHGGVGDINSNGLTRQGDVFTTPGYNPERPVTEIQVQQGVGCTTLEAV